jgi:hypothetical protein
LPHAFSFPSFQSRPTFFATRGSRELVASSRSQRAAPPGEGPIIEIPASGARTARARESSEANPMSMSDDFREEIEMEEWIAAHRSICSEIIEAGYQRLKEKSPQDIASIDRAKRQLDKLSHDCRIY